MNPKYGENASRQRIFLSNRLKLELKHPLIFQAIIPFGSVQRVLKPFKQSVGFQEKHAVAMLHRSQMRLSCNDLRHTFQNIHLYA